MSVLFVLFPLSFAMALVALAAFVWASKAGQFTDLEGPAQRVVFDDCSVDPADKRAKEVKRGKCE